VDWQWRIELLGGLRAADTHEVGRGDRWITRFRTQKTGALLTYLAYQHGRGSGVAQRDVLIDVLWPDCDPSAGRSRLSVALSSLRRQLEPPDRPAGCVLLADRASIRLNPAAVTTDVAEFEAALRSARCLQESAGQTQSLIDAVDLYRGPLLPEYHEDWVLAEREILAEQYFQALCRLIALLEAAGDRRLAIEYARRGLAADPLREEIHLELMRLLAAAGQPGAALRHYRELQQFLQRELGSRPDVSTHRYACELAALTEGSTESDPAAHLPRSLTPFFGRAEEITRLGEILTRRELRLITLTGPGGSGKTRLSLEVAQRVAPAWQGAVWFVSLADLSNARQIPDAIRKALCLPPSPALAPLAQVVATLSRQPTLVVLDNFEHLVVEGASVVCTLLERVPSLTCLITSRQRLRLAGEREFPVLPLPTPERVEQPEALVQCESVQLFLDRAQAARPDFQVTTANAAAVAALCQRLEGIPLALELAAARAQVRTPAQILVQLENRFHFLVSRQRDAMPRHRTLRAALDWSYCLLSPELQRFFSRLCVFRGGWDPMAAEPVCEEPLSQDYLEELRECSFVTAQERAEEIRFGMLETMREYACAQLALEELTELQRRHAEYFLALVEAAEPKLRGVGRDEWLARLDKEHDNLRAALAWSQSATGDGEIGLRLAGALLLFWRMRSSFVEAREWLEQALAHAAASAPTAARAGALYGLGVIIGWQEGDARARAVLEESVAIWRRIGDPQRLAYALTYLSCSVAVNEEEKDTARALWEEIQRLFLQVGDRFGFALSRLHLGIAEHGWGNTATARSLFEESVAQFRAAEDLWNLGISLTWLGGAVRALGDIEAARACWEESAALQRRQGDLARRPGAPEPGPVPHQCSAFALRGESGNPAGDQRRVGDRTLALQPGGCGPASGGLRRGRVSLQTERRVVARTRQRKRCRGLHGATGPTRAWPGTNPAGRRPHFLSYRPDGCPVAADRPSPPAREAGWPHAQADLRAVVSAIRYRLQTRCGWRRLPDSFPPWGTVHYYYRQWRLDGTWQQIHDRLS
jgi:predicted ATPase/DNA-binding SARP family transcriptional activator